MIARFAISILFSFVRLHAQQQPAWQPAPGHTQVPIWPGAIPDARPNAPDSEATVFGPPVGGKPWLAAIYVSRPTMTVYSPPAQNTGVAIVVFPGGGYEALAIDLEGTEVCDMLTSKGITCVLLKYRVPKTGPQWNPQCSCQINPRAPMALEDAQRTIGLVRQHAAEWQIDPHKIGVLGFSAGGHLVADVSTHFDKRAYPAVDDADRESSRPDFAVMLYPGHLWIDYKTLVLSPFVPVTGKTPPTFLLQAEDDRVDDVKHSLVYYLALKNAGVPVEMHLFAQGGHAFGLRKPEMPTGKWPELMQTWLETIGMLSR